MHVPLLPGRPPLQVVQLRTVPHVVITIVRLGSVVGGAGVRERLPAAYEGQVSLLQGGGGSAANSTSRLSVRLAPAGTGSN